MAIDHLYPFAGNNAIQNVVFAVEWAEQLGTSELRAVRDLHDEPKNRTFRLALPKVSEPRVLTINMDDPTGKAMGNQVNELGGIHFTQPSANSIGAMAKALNVSRQNCLAIVTEYSRWNSVWAEVREWFMLVMPTILAKRPVTSFGLQYTDVFQWKANPASLVIGEVLSEQSKYLPKNVFSLPELWHAHHGYIEKRSNPIQHELLENVNVNMLENSGQRAIQIITSHRATLTFPSWAADFTNALDQIIPELHERNKDIMRGLLTSEVQSRIQLHPQS